MLLLSVVAQAGLLPVRLLNRLSTPLEGVLAAENSTAQSAGPVSHGKSTLHHSAYFLTPTQMTLSVASAPPQGMRYLVQNFCDDNAGKPLRSGEPGPNTLEYTPASVGLGVTANVPVRLGIGAGINCATVIERDHCKAEMEGIINACGGHVGLTVMNHSLLLTSTREDPYITRTVVIHQSENIQYRFEAIGKGMSMPV
ncbi:hypothetical protein DFH06DRAFT_1151886 [Mycena polygramma]|nr:hypothetical protein DFH06DRAFT_1151886 [Mycena polygramma]